MLFRELHVGGLGILRKYILLNEIHLSHEQDVAMEWVVSCTDIRTCTVSCIQAAVCVRGCSLCLLHTGRDPLLG